MRPTLDSWALELATVVARRGTCVRRQVGCVLLNRANQVLATGYNGRARGLQHCNERRATCLGDEYPYACAGAMLPSGEGLELCEAIHAEQNALLQCLNVAKIYTCAVTVSPCLTCVKLLLNTSCKRIIFLEDYQQDAQQLWPHLWKRCFIDATITNDSGGSDESVV